jgi:hypothetical protein
MRLKYRNRAIKFLSLGILMIASLVTLILLRKHGIPDGVVAVGAVALGIGGTIFYIQGCVALAEAKGYSGASVAVIIIGTYLFSFIFYLLLPLILFIPLVILFGFKDKTRER